MLYTHVDFSKGATLFPFWTARTKSISILATAKGIFPMSQTF